MSLLPRLYTLQEVAEYTRAPLSTVRSWVYDRRLPTVKLGRHRLVREPDLARFVGATSTDGDK